MKEINWETVYASLDEKGYALLPRVLSVIECKDLSMLYPKNELYRSAISMERYRFGKGEYKYFSYPLPAIIRKMREDLYPLLATLANDWMNQLSIDTQFSLNHSEFIHFCHEKGQLKPTPLILKYESGGFNTLHQDLYGEVYFPFQALFALSEAGQDFEGGEFVMIEQLSRAQSKAQVIHLRQGDALIFTTNFRPVKGTKGYYRAKMKHGVSPLTSGQRFALGIIFHDAA